MRTAQETALSVIVHEEISKAFRQIKVGNLGGGHNSSDCHAAHVLQRENLHWSQPESHTAIARTETQESSHAYSV